MQSHVLKMMAMKMSSIISNSNGSSSNDIDKLLETRKRYIRILDALSSRHPKDEGLRSEIWTAIDAIDAKIENITT